MKKLLAFCIIGTMTSMAHAQASFGLHAAGILSYGSISAENGTDPSNKIEFGMKAGVLVDIPFSKRFSFMPEVNVAFRPTKFTSNADLYQSTYQDALTIKPFFLEVPLNFTYRRPTTNGSFFAGLGPVISLGIAGTYEESESYVLGGDPVTNSRDGDIKFDGKESTTDEHLHLKGVDMGIDVFAGYQWTGGLFMRLLFMQGLSNLNVAEGNTYKSGYFGVGVGYLFGKKKEK